MKHELQQLLRELVLHHLWMVSLNTQIPKAIRAALRGTSAESANFELDKLQGDASSRQYFRLHFDPVPKNFASSLIVMWLPEDALKSDEAIQEGERPTELPFISVQRILAELDVPVPEIVAQKVDARVVLLEDLGSQTFETRLNQTRVSNWSELYRQAIDILVKMQTHSNSLTPCIVNQRSFDRELLGWELDHFKQWGLEAVHGSLDEDLHTSLENTFQTIVQEIVTQPQTLVHRDYQSRNLMWTQNGSLVVIDFQDALTGPYVYDLVALLCDSYVDLDPELQKELIFYFAEKKNFSPEETNALHTHFWWVALQRKLKDAGRFVYIDRVRKNPNFLTHYPQSLRYVKRALEHLKLAELSNILGASLPGFTSGTISPPESICME